MINPLRGRYRLASQLVLLAGVSLEAVLFGNSPAPWPATDGLGRRLPGIEECGETRPEKKVGLLYFLWLGAHGEEGPFDLTRIQENDTDDIDYGPPNAFHFWGEPELGYYLSDDRYVLRRHASLLADAGVDVVALDVSNGHIYWRQLETLCRTWSEVREEGNASPQIMFLAHSEEHETVARLYADFYRQERYPELWFRWKGKPLILADSEGRSDEIRHFFTFRKSWAWSATQWYGDGKGKWPWLDHYPQAPGRDENGAVEQISVSVAQHATTNIGRSFHDGRQPEPENRHPEKGLFFSEQWDRVFEVDPDFVLITGWNEWIAQRFIFDGEIWDRFLGSEPSVGDSIFVDAYSQEYSRDIEPMKGGFGDNYYYQMIAGIRRFKGIPPLKWASGAQSIRIDGLFEDWTPVEPEFGDSVGDARSGQRRLWGMEHERLTVNGRNDFILAKVAADSETVAFYLKCAGEIRLPESESGVSLFVNLDKIADTGWRGYDFVVEIWADCDNGGKTTAAIYDLFGASETKKSVEMSVRTRGAELELSIPRSVFPSDGLGFDFHWVDGISRPYSLEAFFGAKDSAPNRRFDYRFLGSE